MLSISILPVRLQHSPLKDKTRYNQCPYLIGVLLEFNVFLYVSLYSFAVYPAVLIRAELSMFSGFFFHCIL